MPKKNTFLNGKLEITDCKIIPVNKKNNDVLCEAEITISDTFILKGFKLIGTKENHCLFIPKEVSPLVNGIKGNILAKVANNYHKYLLLVA